LYYEGPKLNYWYSLKQLNQVSIAINITNNNIPGTCPEVKSTFVANEPAVIEPELLMFLKTEIVLLT